MRERDPANGVSRQGSMASISSGAASAGEADPGPRYEFRYEGGKVTAYGPNPSRLSQAKDKALISLYSGSDQFHQLIPGVWLHRLLGDPCTYLTNMGLWATRRSRTEADKKAHAAALRERRAEDAEANKVGKFRV